MTLSHLASRILHLAPRISLPVIALLAITLVAQARSPAQTPSPVIQYRQVASVGPSTGGGQVGESHLAVSSDHVFVVHTQKSLSGKEGYVVLDRATNTWSQPADLLIHGALDPSVAYDGANNRFVIAEKKNRNVTITWWDPATGLLSQQAHAITSPPGGNIPDKPWIVRGTNNAFRQEFYATSWEVLASRFARSLDGGQTWTSGLLPVISTFSIEPTVATSTNSSPLYLAWTTLSGNFRFLRGDDNGTSVDFSDLMDSSGSPIEVPLVRACYDCNPQTPGLFPVKHSPHIAADPTNPDRLYFVYFDEVAPPSGDFDVFCVSLKHSGGSWSVGTPVRVNDDTNLPPEHSDQVLPDLAVDSAGRVHIVFYDDRNYDQADNEHLGKFDVYYAYSLDRGLTFQNKKLAGRPDQPVLDYTLNSFNLTENLEYPGIATSGNEVWVAFAGSYDRDTSTPDKSVIYVTRIQF